MAISAVTSTSSDKSTAGAATDSQKAFRQADFLKIMLSELTNQSPFDPQDTGKLVENMQKLQALANTTFQKFRSDITWAQGLMGQQVKVQQAAINPAEESAFKNKGLNPDVGFGNVDGRVGGFRVVDETVYVTVGQKDYPIDSVKQIVPNAKSPDHLAEVANSMLGRSITYFTDAEHTKSATGTVSNVAYDQDGGIELTVGNNQVPYDRLQRIGLVPKP